MLNKGDEQRQQVGAGATAIQAAGNVTINAGLSYTEVRDVALDVFKANFLQLSGEAREAARERAEEITDKFLRKAPSGKAGRCRSSPNTRLPLRPVFRAARLRADRRRKPRRSLVDLLVDRTKHADRNMAQIVLNECLVIAPKLTNQQLSALAVIFFMKYCGGGGILTIQQMAGQLAKFVLPFLETLPAGVASYQHLEFAGCGAIQVTSSGLEDILGTRYLGVFDKGVPPDELSGASFYFNQHQQLTGPSALEAGRIQVKAQNKENLEQIISSYRLSQGDAERLRAAFGKNRLSTAEIKSKCLEAVPQLQKLFEIWQSASLHNFTLTSVGIGLAHANIKRLTGEFADLSIWLN